MSDVKETEDIYRLYCREWVTAHTVSLTTTRAEECITAADLWVTENLTGRVVLSDVRFQLSTDRPSMLRETPEPAHVWTHIQVFRDNLKGEFRDAPTASRFAENNGFEEYTVTVRNSRVDHQIRNYGVTKL